MAHLIIKNIGPINEVEFDLNQYLHGAAKQWKKYNC